VERFPKNAIEKFLRSDLKVRAKGEVKEEKGVVVAK
jgi:hypothetical protein